VRKFIVAATIAALGVGLLAVPASASFDHHFTVISKQVSGEPISSHAFRFKDKLFQPGNRSNRVGRDKGICREASNRNRIRCHAVVHLNGEIGGFGDLLVAGNIGPGDKRMNVVGGTGDFNGVAGKLQLHTLSRIDRLHFDLVR
jgi:hypothetical protein